MNTISSSTSHSNHNYGIDLLKILSMLMVVVYHILLKGGILSQLSPSSIHYRIASLLEWLVTPCVNIFVLCTGYLYANRQWKLGGILKLYASVLFYSFFGTLFAALLGVPVNGKQWLFSCLP